MIASLVEDATRTDAQIAELNGMKAGTVATVRRRLMDAGAVFYVNVPAFNRLGCEMMACHLGTMDPAQSFESKTSDYMEFVKSSPQIFDAIIGAKSIAFYSVLRNATELENLKAHHSRFFSGDRKRSMARISSISFPYSVSKGTYALNYAPTVRRFFRLDSPCGAVCEPTSVEVTSPDLTENEKKVLTAIVENPGEPDRAIAARVGISRQSVTRIRNKLDEEGYFRLVCVPRLYRWGFEIFSVVRVFFSSDFAYSDRADSQPKEPVMYSFFSLIKAEEAIANHMIWSFHDYTKGLDAGLAWYHRENAFEENPMITLLSLEHCLELRTHDFAPALRHVLERC
ncbi:MAG: winged helix-turn-helix transcriptional regulator [Methanobacteriota archaeon]|nr:MAG: winged helix-turn-helix transcriptional regulator [Euryarchaeota archaeon]